MQFLDVSLVANDIGDTSRQNEKCYLDSYDPDDLENIISTQNEITKHLKQQGRAKIFNLNSC